VEAAQLACQKTLKAGQLSRVHLRIKGFSQTVHQSGSSQLREIRFVEIKQDKKVDGCNLSHDLTRGVENDETVDDERNATLNSRASEANCADQGCQHCIIPVRDCGESQVLHNVRQSLLPNQDIKTGSWRGGGPCSALTCTILRSVWLAKATFEVRKFERI
jgi:hypothetical protein